MQTSIERWFFTCIYSFISIFSKLRERILKTFLQDLVLFMTNTQSLLIRDYNKGINSPLVLLMLQSLFNKDFSPHDGRDVDVHK